MALTPIKRESRARAKSNDSTWPCRSGMDAGVLCAQFKVLFVVVVMLYPSFQRVFGSLALCIICDLVCGVVAAAAFFVCYGLWVLWNRRIVVALARFRIRRFSANCVWFYATARMSRVQTGRVSGTRCLTNVGRKNKSAQRVLSKDICCGSDEYDGMECQVRLRIVTDFKIS